MRQSAALTAMLLAALTTGCVDRKFVVTSDTPHTAVYLNGVYKGTTPVDDSFVYYGKYEFKLVDPTGAHETLVALLPQEPEHPSGASLRQRLQAAQPANDEAETGAASAGAPRSMLRRLLRR